MLTVPSSHAGGNTIWQRSPSGSVSEAMGLSRSSFFWLNTAMAVANPCRFDSDNDSLGTSRQPAQSSIQYLPGLLIANSVMFAIKASEIPNLRISSRTERERSTRLIGLSTASLNNVKDIFKAHVTRHHDVYNRRGKHHQSGWDVDRIAQRLSGHILGGLIGV